MELRRCGHEHFIQAIRAGVVIKVLNMNHRRQDFSFKLLKDVCESIDAKAPTQHTTTNNNNVNAYLPVDRTLREVKAEPDEFVPDSSALENDLDDATTLRQLKDRFMKRKRKSSHTDEHFKPVNAEVDTTLREIKSEKDESVPHPDHGLVSDLDDSITLKQLKKRFHRKNRKSGIPEEHSTLSYSNESSVGNGSNLSEPTIVLESKNSRESKAKKEYMTGSVASSSTSIMNTKSQLNFVSEGSQLVGSDLTPNIPVKDEDDAMELEIPKETSVSGEPSCCSVEVPCREVSSDIQTIKVQPETREPLSPLDGCQNCVTNKISYDNLLDIEPISMFDPSDGTNDASENTELLCHEVLEEISEQNSSSCVSNIDMGGLTCEQDYSLSSLNKNCSPSRISVNSLKADETLVPLAVPDEQHPLTCTLDDMTESGLTCRSSMNDLLMDEKQALESLNAYNECRSFPKNQSLDCVDMDSTIESCRPPERLLSTRKAISPSSQERLCSAMKSDDDLCNGAGQYIGSEHKEQLHVVEAAKKDSSARSDIHHAKRAVNHVGNGHIRQRKIYISPRHIVKKSLKSKVNLEGPRYSRVLPNISTECTSIQGCSESAIAFSQRQMQDMESLTFKLMDELDSMKSIVEQKLLFEAYRNVSLKSDADEVKSAINSASKMEETARKWLSTMTRDCRRFCTIMKLTPNNSPDSKGAASRERRKIVFADEAGGKLCHIKYFEVGGDTLKQ
ncbi:homeobox-leucine zipper family protein /lipid-binding START domain-containing protein [Striga asiatica]|uniref:Homeobox-leucine zipper family protein /lipid-binding START domain-containing protein n=1 Tax=Striga asiatica TaxID=4170 RepID=A0A5A7QB81_STRAF|nr:homeobox-leucine zipper family protein /lipid-binding START domain-containing protein [Striga asiatica]